MTDPNQTLPSPRGPSHWPCADSNPRAAASPRVPLGLQLTETSREAQLQLDLTPLRLPEHVDFLPQHVLAGHQRLQARPAPQRLLPAGGQPACLEREVRRSRGAPGGGLTGGPLRPAPGVRRRRRAAKLGAPQGLPHPVRGPGDGVQPPGRAGGSAHVQEVASAQDALQHAIGKGGQGRESSRGTLAAFTHALKRVSRHRALCTSKYSVCVLQVVISGVLPCAGDASGLCRWGRHALRGAGRGCRGTGATAGSWGGGPTPRPKAENRGRGPKNSRTQPTHTQSCRIFRYAVMSKPSPCGASAWAGK